jgi:hypothetical protein
VVRQKAHYCLVAFKDRLLERGAINVGAMVEKKAEYDLAALI